MADDVRQLFPEVTRGRWQVSTGGGTRPLWARSGQELFYLAPTGAVMRVAVASSPAWTATTPTQLFGGRYYAGSVAILGRTYDVSADGRRFLMIKPGAGAGAGAGDDGAHQPRRRAELGRRAEAAGTEELTKPDPGLIDRRRRVSA